ncbi:MAG: hypothetical protein RL711_327 [Bacteroidota bacterium]
MQQNNWLIKCSHTPESLDRIMMSFRKRGLTVESVFYQRVDDNNATCKVVFDEDETQAKRIYNNLIRLVDVHEISIV